MGGEEEEEGWLGVEEISLSSISRHCKRINESIWRGLDFFSIRKGQRERERDGLRISFAKILCAGVNWEEFFLLFHIHWVRILML